MARLGEPGWGGVDQGARLRAGGGGLLGTLIVRLESVAAWMRIGALVGLLAQEIRSRRGRSRR